MSVTATLPRSEEPSNFTPPEKPAPPAQNVAVTVVLLLVLVAAVWSVIDLRINLATFIDSFHNAIAFVSRIFPLDFPPFLEIVRMTVQTLAIVVVATVLAVVISIPLALLAAANTTPGGTSRTFGRVAIVIARAIPDLIFAVILFRIFGLGALPGILALAFHSVGMVGKLYADAIESIDEGPVEAIRASGGSRAQQIISGVFPQVMPQFIATALHRFDINLRTSVILGYVGVVGIGLEISNAMRTMNYDRGVALALVVLVLCIITELISGSIRAKLMGHEEAKKKGAYGLAFRIADAFSQGWVSSSRTRSTPGPDGHTPQTMPDGAVRTSPPWTLERMRRSAYLGLVLVVLAVSTLVSDISFGSIVDGLRDLPQTLSLFWPPSAGDMLGDLVHGMIVTLQIGLAATLLGAVISVPIGVLAARNAAPNPSVHKFFRITIVAVRALPDLILAIIFIVITGLGPVAGTLALAIGSIGLLSKLLADSIEETDERVQEAIRANGATRSQVFFASTLRQSFPAFVAHVLYQLDSNIRAATLLGIVGAGGIGFYLMGASRVMSFDVVTFIIIMILVVVLLVEALSVWTRKVIR
ncbi:hypothetical protein GCM10022261_05430 [Brevibacterium daeguense]|uniref:ABC transmembrane type-1 domain-containing protein n=1 Tax=Brevibacterium daeguense TaxID=909936 RepID=A0ABP8EGB8_9MICO|nr:phosphonate ABC transporter, permease protein PhnE [Brevibacterium daeguense]